MNVIVTGANGFIGSHLVKKFLDAGDTVYAIVKDTNEDISHIRECSNIIYCGLDKLDSIYDELKNVANPVFYHLAWAGVNGTSKADYTTQIMNVKMALDVASFAKKLNARCFLCAGTIAEKAVDSSLPWRKSLVVRCMVLERLQLNISLKPIVRTSDSRLFGCVFPISTVRTIRLEISFLIH